MSAAHPRVVRRHQMPELRKLPSGRGDPAWPKKVDLLLELGRPQGWS